jgi:hypothetical protein
MGKRRSLKPHERFDASDDDEDDTYEDVKEQVNEAAWPEAVAVV